MPESGGAGGDTILDELKNFQLSSGLTISAEYFCFFVYDVDYILAKNKTCV